MSKTKVRLSLCILVVAVLTLFCICKTGPDKRSLSSESEGTTISAGQNEKPTYTTSVSDGKAYSEHLKKGEELYVRNQMDSAKNELRQAIVAAPDSAEAYGWLGNILLAQDSISDAKVVLLRGKEKNQSVPTIRYTLGNLLMKEGQYDSAEAEYKALLDLSPINTVKALGYNGLGSVSLRKNDLPGAESLFRKAMEVYRDMPYPHVNLAQVLLMQEKSEKEAELELHTAMTLFQELEEPVSPVCHVLLGSLLLEEYKDTAGAREQYLKAIDADSTFPYVHFFLGILNYKEGKIDEAEESCLEAIQVDSTYPFFYSFLGIILSQKGDFKGAEKEFRKAIKLAESFFKDDTEKIISTRKALFDFLIVKGVTEYKNVNFDEALKIGKSILKELEDVTLLSRETTDSLRSNALFLIGNVQMQQGKYRQAKKSYGKVLELEPINQDALYNLSRAYLSLRQFNKAQLAATTALGLEKDSSTPKAELIKNLQNLIEKYRSIAAGVQTPSLGNDSQIDTSQIAAGEGEVGEKREGAPVQRVRLRWWQFIPLVICFLVVVWVIYLSFKNKAPEFLKPLLLIFVPLFFLFSVVFVAYPVISSLNVSFGDVGSIQFDLTKVESLPLIDPAPTDIINLSNLFDDLETLILKDLNSKLYAASASSF